MIASSAAAEPFRGAAGNPSAEAIESAAAGEAASVVSAESAAGEDNATEISNAGAEEEAVESVGGADAMEEVPERMSRACGGNTRSKEVIKRRQVMLVQVVKERRHQGRRASSPPIFPWPAAIPC